METNQGGNLAGVNLSQKYYDIEFNIAFPTGFIGCIPIDTASNGTTAASSNPALIVIDGIGTKTGVRIVSDVNFNNTGVGKFAWFAWGH